VSEIIETLNELVNEVRKDCKGFGLGLPPDIKYDITPEESHYDIDKGNIYINEDSIYWSQKLEGTRVGCKKEILHETIHYIRDKYLRSQDIKPDIYLEEFVARAISELIYRKSLEQIEEEISKIETYLNKIEKQIKIYQNFPNLSKYYIHEYKKFLGYLHALILVKTVYELGLEEKKKLINKLLYLMPEDLSKELSYNPSDNFQEFKPVDINTLINNYLVEKE